MLKASGVEQAVAVNSHLFQIFTACKNMPICYIVQLLQYFCSCRNRQIKVKLYRQKSKINTESNTMKKLTYAVKFTYMAQKLRSISLSGEDSGSLLFCRIIRPHCSTTCVGVTCCYRPSSVICWSVCLSVCLSVTAVSRAKTAEPIEMPFWLRTRVGSRTMY